MNETHWTLAFALAVLLGATIALFFQYFTEKNRRSGLHNISDALQSDQP